MRQETEQNNSLNNIRAGLTLEQAAKLQLTNQLLKEQKEQLTRPKAIYTKPDTSENLRIFEEPPKKNEKQNPRAKTSLLPRIAEEENSKNKSYLGGFGIETHQDYNQVDNKEKKPDNRQSENLQEKTGFLKQLFNCITACFSHQEPEYQPMTENSPQSPNNRGFATCAGYWEKLQKNPNQNTIISR